MRMFTALRSVHSVHVLVQLKPCRIAAQLLAHLGMPCCIAVRPPESPLCTYMKESIQKCGHTPVQATTPALEAMDAQLRRYLSTARTASHVAV